MLVATFGSGYVVFESAAVWTFAYLVYLLQLNQFLFYRKLLECQYEFSLSLWLFPYSLVDAIWTDS